MFTKHKLWQLLAVTTIFPVLGTVVMTSEFASAQQSQDAQPPNPLSPPEEKPLWVGGLIPSEGTGEYTALPPGGKITGRLGLPAAQLIDPPSELAQEIAVWIPPQKAEPIPPGAVGFEINSSTRYRGNGHTIYVTTYRFTPAAAKMKHTFGKPDKLSDGTTVGTSVACESIPKGTLEGYYCTQGSPTPNEVVFMRGNLIVTVASDLPIDQIKDLAKNASLK